MKKEERVSIFIDGNNTFFKLRDFGFQNLSGFNYRGLAEWLAHGRTIVACQYYIGVVRAQEHDIKGQGMRRAQQRLFAHLASPEQNFIIKQGYLMKNGGKYHEKGVDVEIAVDLLVGAYENLYGTAILISSDSDLVPAVRKVKELKKMVEHIGFARHPAFALQRNATISRLLIKEELEPFETRKEKALDGDETP